MLFVKVSGNLGCSAQGVIIAVDVNAANQPRDSELTLQHEALSRQASEGTPPAFPQFTHDSLPKPILYTEKILWVPVCPGDFYYLFMQRAGCIRALPAFFFFISDLVVSW